MAPPSSISPKIPASWCMAAENSGVDGLGRRDGGGGELAVPELCGGEDSASGAEAALAPVAGGHDGFGFDAKRPFVADSINSDLAMIAGVLGDMQKHGINMPKVLEDPGNESECEKLSTYFDKWVPGAGDGSNADAMQPGGKAGKEGWEKDFEKLVGNSMFDARGSLGQKWQKQKASMKALSWPNALCDKATNKARPICHPAIKLPVNMR